MGPTNTAGGAAIDLSPPAPVDPVELARRIHRGEWVIDLRRRAAFAEQHLAGTIGIELSDQFSTYLAWLMPWGMPVTLLADDTESIAEAQRQHVRVGIDRPAGAASGQPDTWALGADRRSYDLETFADMTGREPSLEILDVRRNGEFAASHLDGATSIPLHELLGRLDEVPAGLVHEHCQSASRASIAPSLLDRAGHDVVLIDDSFDNAADSGIALVTD